MNNQFTLQIKERNRTTPVAKNKRTSQNVRLGIPKGLLPSQTEFLCTLKNGVTIRGLWVSVSPSKNTRILYVHMPCLYGETIHGLKKHPENFLCGNEEYAW